MAAQVDAKSSYVTGLEEGWAIAEALMGGTPAMRKAGTKLLPQWPKEDKGAYEARKDTATLFPAFRRTVQVMAGKPFAKALSLSDDAPEQIKLWAEDIDREGVNLHTFASEMLAEALAYGLAGILVDAPSVEQTGAVLTRAQQQQAGVRPYFVRIMHNQLLGWRIKTTNGVRSLDMLRISEDVIEPDGDFGERLVKQVRVLTPGKSELFRKASGNTNEWASVSTSPTGLNYIPFVPVYGWKRGFMDGVSPLLDLAYLNVKHWQSQSDQDTILHTARVPILAIIGANESTSLTIGGSSAVTLPAGGDMKWIEHGGSAIKAGQESLTALEEQMIQAGAELLVKKPGQRTATEANNDAEANKSDLQRLSEGFEDSLDRALEIMADFGGQPSGGSVSLFKDYGATNLTDASGQLILAMVEAGLISRETGLEEMKRRGEIRPEVDYETEQERIADEMPGDDTAADLTGALPPDQDNPDLQQDLAV